MYLSIPYLPSSSLNKIKYPTFPSGTFGLGRIFIFTPKWVEIESPLTMPRTVIRLLFVLNDSDILRDRSPDAHHGAILLRLVVILRHITDELLHGDLLGFLAPDLSELCELLKTSLQIRQRIELGINGIVRDIPLAQGVYIEVTRSLYATTSAHALHIEYLSILRAYRILNYFHILELREYDSITLLQSIRFEVDSLFLKLLKSSTANLACIFVPAKENRSVFDFLAIFHFLINF